MKPRSWYWPFLLVQIFVLLLSFRQLSDPDLGFHLKYGQWIAEHHQVPVSDLSTYTVSDHSYTDLHWLFQLLLFGLYRVTGYPGISLFFCLAALLLSWLLAWRMKALNVKPWIIGTGVFTAFLILDPRLAPRPEMFTFLFLSLLLHVLECYQGKQDKLVWIIPVILLFWCNMHALFILGILVLAVYTASHSLHNRRPEKKLLLILGLSIAACCINPYGIKSYTLPVELLTRFDPQNIYNQHIREFTPFFSQTRFVLRDYLFIAYLAVVLLYTVATIRKRRVHEILLVLMFGLLAIGSVRNVPLFVITTLPYIGSGLSAIHMHRSGTGKFFEPVLFSLLIVIPLLLIPRLITGAWYLENNSFNKTGIGVNDQHQPRLATDFITRNHLTGRILNSLGLGGWLSWALPCPVFIDGRLEVIREDLYREVTESWNGGLPQLVAKYKPRMIIYNYLRYYPWSLQLKEMKGWRLLYADGFTALFADSATAGNLPVIRVQDLPLADTPAFSGTFSHWFEGFYRKPDYAAIDQVHRSILHAQLTATCPANPLSSLATGCYNRANRMYHAGNIHGALAAYDSAIALQPGYVKALNNRGILRAGSMKDYNGAIEDFNRAIEADPRNSDPWLGRGTVWYFLGDMKSACSDWHHASLLGNAKAAQLSRVHCTHQ